MKNYLIAMSLLTVGLTNFVQTKQAFDEYDIPNMKIKIDHERYLKNVKENIKASIKDRNHILTNNLIIWSKQYIKQFNELKNKEKVSEKNIVDISEFEKFIENSKKYLNRKKISPKIANEVTFLEVRISNLHNMLQDAINNYNSEEYADNKLTLKNVIKKYDLCFREYTKVITTGELQDNPPFKIYEKLQNFKDAFTKQIKGKIVKYIKMHLTTIETKLKDFQKELEGSLKEVNQAQKVNDWHMQYLEITEVITLLKSEKIHTDFSLKISSIDKLLVTLKTLLETKGSELIVLWKDIFTNTKTSIAKHNDKIEQEGEWEKIEQLLVDFKDNIKKFHSFKNKSTDLKLECKEIIDLITEIKTAFTKTNYRGVTKNESSGTWSQWHLSEPAWDAFRVGANTAGIVTPPFTGLALENAHRLITHRMLVKVPTMTIEITGRRFSQIITNKIFWGSWVGLGVGFGLFTIPAASINFIKTKGAGLSFKYNYCGFVTGFLAPSIEIHKTAKPQEMKHLNVWDIETVQ